MSITYSTLYLFSSFSSKQKSDIYFRMSQIFFNRFSMRVIHYIFLFVKLSFNSSIILHEINQAVFLDPKTNTAVIQCPLDFIHSLDIQWYDVNNQQYELDRGRYYRINGLQPFDRELICSSVSQIGHGNNEKYRIKIRIYGKRYVYCIEQ